MKTIWIILLLLVCAWNWPTHEDFSVKVYESFPQGVQSKLNLSLVKEGSIIPDKVFQDFEYHSYPRSVAKSEFWLNKSYTDFLEENYASASISLGIATHYISDSFAAPHTINGEEYRLHSKFETEAEGVPFYARCTIGTKDLELYLLKSQESEKDWAVWLKNGNRNIQSKELSHALFAGYALSHAYYNIECNQPFLIIFIDQIRILKFRFF